MKYIIALNIDDHTPARFPFKAVGRLQKLKQLLQQFIIIYFIHILPIRKYKINYIIMEGGQTRALNRMDGTRRFVRMLGYKNYLGMEG